MAGQKAQTGRLAGCLLGMALGDALGLPCEGLSRQRQSRMFRDVSGFHFVFGKGMVSDDTEHACMTAQALLKHSEDEAAFAKALGWKLRWWLLCLPAGVGLATLRACLRLWIGIPPQRSGVISAGNGPAMRAVILGAALADDHDRLRRFVRAATEITHRDPRAEAGALAVALAAAMESSQQRHPELFLQRLATLCPEQSEFLQLINETVARLTQPEEEFLAWLGCGKGISGYMLHTVPAVIWFWLQADDFETSLIRLIRCGGDTDTTAAILGGILGARGEGLPQGLLNALWEWPRTVPWMRQLAQSLSLSLAGTAQRVPRLNPFLLLLRNLLFTLIVLLHGFRRLAPPY